MVAWMHGPVLWRDAESVLRTSDVPHIKIERIGPAVRQLECLDCRGGSFDDAEVDRRERCIWQCQLSLDGVALSLCPNWHLQ